MPETPPPELLVALARHFDSKSSLLEDARAACAPGEHAIRGAVQIAGVLKIGQPYLATPTPRLSGLQVATLFVAILVQQKRVTKQRALAIATEVLERALSESRSEEQLEALGDELVVEVIRTKAQVQARIAELLPREPRNGHTSFRGFAEPIEPRATFARNAL